MNEIDLGKEKEAPSSDGASPLIGEPAMRLRPEPPRVTRISRKVLAGLGLIVGAGLGGVLIYALQTRNAGKPEELISTDGRAIADGIAGLPRDYTGPILGPPLPGDLGGPILNAQNAVPSPVITTPDQGLTAEEQHRQQEMESARTAKLFAPTATRPVTSDTPATTQTISTNQSMSDLTALGLGPQPSTPTAIERQNAFLDAMPDKHTVSPDRVAAPVSPYVLQAGAVISAALITGIRSDLPGQITAQVTENTYDSPTGRLLLVPQGTRVIGQYSNDVGFGQRRILLVWNRLIFPDGRSIVLERQPGADAEGYAGLQDGVDFHWWELAKATGLSTLLSVGTELATNDEDRLLRAIRNGAQDTINDAAQQIIRHQLDIAPTLTIRAGFPVRVIVTRDLVLEPYGGGTP
jgi:type IV secretion system protein VirB10